jgi:hypothetical protein
VGDLAFSKVNSSLSAGAAGGHIPLKAPKVCARFVHVYFDLKTENFSVSLGPLPWFKLAASGCATGL